MNQEQKIKGFNALYEGNEALISNEKPLRYNMTDFWRINLSTILLNMTRGSFAEFLVICAMEECGFHALSQIKNGVEAWDIDGPSIKHRKHREQLPMFGSSSWHFSFFS